MELNEALKVVLELAEQNMLSDPEMEFEMLRQFNAIENVRMHMQELQNPSPLQVVLITEGGVIHESISNVPAEVTVLDGDLECAESSGVRLFPSEGDAEYLVCGPSTECNPTRVATLLNEAEHTATKSSALRQWAAANNIPIVDIPLEAASPDDFNGIPLVHPTGDSE